ncbi:MAG: 23S rRNA (uracil(1939)-C(5))-methyltransferase RlmD [Alphaproteobacteria bacterium]|nr:23S rRNA (uracil(1939)-C(5))-methyltransferase RlmD [Alphaproteobacteria bacterium]
MAETFDLEITALGARGDGIASLGGTRVIVPGALPGERVRARIGRARRGGRGKSDAPPRARSVEIVERAPDRITPACRHFGTCGGCTIQHLAAAPALAWKRRLIAEALDRRGLPDEVVRPVTAIEPGVRRRADFTAIRRRDDVLLGFNEAASHNVVDIAECPVLLPEIAALLGPLRAFLHELLTPAERAEAVVNATETGLDLVLVTATKLGAGGRSRMAQFAEDRDLARISRRHPQAETPEIVAERRAPMAPFGGFPVRLPPGAFLQASAAGEASLVASVIAIVNDATRIADLYCGCGSFTFALAAHRSGKPGIHAVDGNEAAVAAVRAAANAAGLTRVTSEQRDLDRRPLRFDELARFDAVVFDPPRAGAKAQAMALAESRVPVIAAVSCHPASFARDADILAAGGYTLDWVQPVDQFPWTPHVELVARFYRAA